ncbi:MULTISPECIES: tetratricopeptide repeat protein [unclassified Microcystis]|uniref:tetratricopeptide repeat protein n=1 Tax=unclassified Microcystis TaxID=2643300 RepID=UPI0025838A9A|nr:MULTISPECIES: tetratricopeptide repeat protein [unclassified Microcystis]MCA2765415.1 tetratricopeptide repeat protein [Microcystis sp. M151S2]MCA2641936.1 tetratricopeptide repeat protein [Microcystis sp. M087S2]MCA2670231.1 tetratricopeptide repeat protein [Microcystis sp. M080S2]MCA2688255.1 tetratricopeptide repeat protein [Microcystis sp. M037S2]MCA2734501.1 tetratricopeptide repeat protein [Microcystis sp. M158S2]
MLDPQEFRNIIHQDFTEVTSQEFLANQKKYCPEIFEGDNYPNITENLNNLAKLYQSQGRYAEAESLYLQALELRKRLLGENHPATVKIRKNLQKMRQQQHPSY